MSKSKTKTKKLTKTVWLVEKCTSKGLRGNSIFIFAGVFLTEHKAKASVEKRQPDNEWAKFHWEVQEHGSMKDVLVYKQERTTDLEWRIFKIEYDVLYG